MKTPVYDDPCMKRILNSRHFEGAEVITLSEFEKSAYEDPKSYDLYLNHGDLFEYLNDLLYLYSVPVEQQPDVVDQICEDYQESYARGYHRVNFDRVEEILSRSHV